MLLFSNWKCTIIRQNMLFNSEFSCFFKCRDTTLTLCTTVCVFLSLCWHCRGCVSQCWSLLCRWVELDECWNVVYLFLVNGYHMESQHHVRHSQSGCGPSCSISDSETSQCKYLPDEFFSEMPLRSLWRRARRPAMCDGDSRLLLGFQILTFMPFNDNKGGEKSTLSRIIFQTQ